MKLHRPRASSKVASAMVRPAVSGFVGLMACTALASPPEQPEGEPVRGCRLEVFVNDPDPSGLNIRSAPGTKGRIVASIVDGDAMIEVTGSSGNWLRVQLVRGVDGTVHYKGQAWVFGPLTGVRAERTVVLRAAPQKTSPVVATMPAEQIGEVQACDARWVRVRNGRSAGWMAPGAHCGNSVTGCV